jgi:hypothetical protein
MTINSIGIIIIAAGGASHSLDFYWQTLGAAAWNPEQVAPPGSVGQRPPDRGQAKSFPLGIERDHVAAVLVERLAAGQAPWPARRLPAPVADPEPGPAPAAADAELDGVRQPAERGRGAPPGLGRGCGSPAGLVADRDAGGRLPALDEPSGQAIAARPAGLVRRQTDELGRRAHRRAGWPGQAGQPTPDAIHDHLL